MKIFSKSEKTAEERRTLLPEDYLEPDCPLCMERPGGAADVNPIPQRRVLDKLDAYMGKRDYEGAERHLLYWMQEALQGNDQRGQLLLCNELIGHYRKTAQREKAFEYAERALSLLKRMDFEGSITAGTTRVNAATAYSAFGEHERALELFTQAREIYESVPEIQPHLLGGLYNNMGLAFQALGEYAAAFHYYERAMEQMGKVPGGVLEQAITCLNMADTVAAEKGLEQGESRIFELLDQAEALLQDDTVNHDGYYAFVCEKCAPSFAYYGYFAVAEQLQKEAKEIYERS